MLPVPRSQPWSDRSHHAADGTFRNPDPAAQPASFMEVVPWITCRAFQAKTNVPPPVHTVDPVTLHAPSEGLRITWIGHATLLLQWPNATMLTDPMFSDRASPLSWAGQDEFTSDRTGPVEGECVVCMSPCRTSARQSTGCGSGRYAALRAGATWLFTAATATPWA